VSRQLRRPEKSAWPVMLDMAIERDRAVMCLWEVLEAEFEWLIM